MKLVLDPIDYWSDLHAFLGASEPVVWAAAGLATAVAFALPILLLRPPAAVTRRKLIAAGGLVLLWLLVVALRSGGGSSRDKYPWYAVVGLLLLLLAPAALAGVSVGTALGLAGTSGRRRAVVVALRLAAFLLTMIAIARPALGFLDANQPPSQLLIALDFSKSMTIQDESGKESRWQLLRRTLKKCEPALARLRDEQQVEVLFSRFAGDVEPFDPADPGTADGKRTDYGTMLRKLADGRDPRAQLRGLLLVGDGTDHGTTFPALGEAARWRGLPCRVHTFASGSPATTLRQNDVAITAITTEPTPVVRVKGRLKVKVTVDARGYEDRAATLRLFMEQTEEKDGKRVKVEKEVKAQEVALRLTTGNEFVLECDAPPTPGEVKVRVVAETAPADAFPVNNTIETFVTVAKDGISVLLVDKRRAFEPQAICDALSDVAALRVTPVWLSGDRPADGAGRNLFRFEEQAYDVILIGDVTPAQVQAADPEALAKIRKLVAAGSGLAMLGGYASFGEAWKKTPVEPLLPVVLGENEQVEAPVRVKPTEDGLRLARYLFNLDDGKDLQAAWQRLPELEGMTALTPHKPLRPNETVLATVSLGGDVERPILIMQNYGDTARGVKPKAGAARALAFGGDTTWRWVRDDKGKELHARFWRRLVVWLAQQEDAEGSVWVKPEVRRLPAREPLAFAVGVRGKGGGPDLPGGTYEVRVTGPDGKARAVPVSRKRDGDGGSFLHTDAPGVYEITVKGKAPDPSGGVVEGAASARFIVYDEDLEMTRAAADHAFLERLAKAGGGEALRVEDLPAFLDRLRQEANAQGRPKLDLRPDWRRTTRSPFLIVFFLLFTAVVSLEWGLRRRWGLV